MFDAPHKRVGVVGARGYAGAELVRLLDAHPRFELAFAASRSAAGKPVAELIEGVTTTLTFEPPSVAAALGHDCDALVLALPNKASHEYVREIDGAVRDVVVVDLSADHRFDDAWAYGLPELQREVIHGARRIANPGCYATAAQLVVAPLLDELSGTPRVFGVSGYSGAGTSPSPKNDPERLRDNLMPYALTGHVHEREMSRQLGTSIYFMPHVASFFRGITLTVSVELNGEVPPEALIERYRERYRAERLVEVLENTPLVRDAVGDHRVHLGGISTRSRHAVIVATIDNLLKGAATQAVQNLNLALGLDELCGIHLAGG